MRISVWSDGSCPVYVDPTVEEVVELASRYHDTLRIIEGEGHTALASGYGNTHSSVYATARLILGKRWSGLDLILFKELNEWYWNPLGHWKTHSERVRLELGLRIVTERTKLIVKDFVQIQQDMS